MAVIEKRTNSDGETTFRVKVRLKGKPSESATFRRITDAKKWAIQTEADIRDGRHFKTSQAKKHTLTQLIDRYIKDVLPNKTSSQKVMVTQKKQLEWWKSEIGDYLLADVTPALIVECRDKLSGGEIRKGVKRSPATVVRYMAALSHAFTIAAKEWMWLDDSPMRKVTKPKEPRGRVRFLSDDERQRLLQACQKSNHPYLYIVVVLALATGMRLGEILKMRWEDVNFEKGYIILHETKNSERRRIPLVDHAHKVLQALHKNRNIVSSLVFPDFRKRIADKVFDHRTAWLNALEKAKILDFKFHDLRHSAASYLAMNGASLAEIAEVLGHKTLQMVKRYAHLSEAHTSKVVASMNAKIFG